jgi:hypothetical protein
VRARHRAVLRPAAGPVWVSAKGDRLTYTGLHTSLKQGAADAGIIGFHLHRLRHTMAVRWMRAGSSETGLMAPRGLDLQHDDRSLRQGGFRTVGGGRVQLARPRGGRAVSDETIAVVCEDHDDPWLVDEFTKVDGYSISAQSMPRPWQTGSAAARPCAGRRPMPSVSSMPPESGIRQATPVARAGWDGSTPATTCGAHCAATTG